MEFTENQEPTKPNNETFKKEKAKVIKLTKPKSPFEFKDSYYKGAITSFKCSYSEFIQPFMTSRMHHFLSFVDLKDYIPSFVYRDALRFQFRDQTVIFYYMGRNKTVSKAYLNSLFGNDDRPFLQFRKMSIAKIKNLILEIDSKSKLNKDVKPTFKKSTFKNMNDSNFKDFIFEIIKKGQKFEDLLDMFDNNNDFRKVRLCIEMKESIEVYEHFVTKKQNNFS